MDKCRGGEGGNLSVGNNIYSQNDEPTSAVEGDLWIDLDEVGEEITAESIGAVPTSRKINGKALSEDITLTSDDVGARPSTWTPTAEDVGARPSTWVPTAEEVGARPSTWMPTAEEVGARPSTWMPTAAQVGAAPAGLSELFWVDSEENLNTQIAAVYNGMGDNTAKSVVLADYVGFHPLYGGNWHFWFYRTSANHGWIEGRSYSGYTLVREIINGVWQPWKYPNPLMHAGVEYCTTELYMGQPVYTQLVDCGTPPNTGTSTTPLPTGMGYLVSWFGIVSYYGVSFPGDNDGWKCRVSQGTGNIILTTDSDRSNKNSKLYVTLKYTKL